MYFQKKRCIAMLLAGGQGSRLKVLTEKLGRPALTFDKYTPLVYTISAAFGIYSTWQEYTVDGETQVLFYMNAPRYQDYVDYMNKLYK